MNTTHNKNRVTSPVHPWLHEIGVSFVPGPRVPLLEEVADGLLNHFRFLGHRVQDVPNEHTDVILTTAHFGDPLDWRESLIFTTRRRFDLDHAPTIYTLMHMTPAGFQGLLSHFQTVLEKEPPGPAGYDFPGLAPEAYQVLFEQGRRGGPILALERLVQGQTKSIHVLLVVGDDRPLAVYHFDLVGAYPRTEAENLDLFYQDIVLRIVTTVSTSEVTEHEVVGETIPHDLWQRLDTPVSMCAAARQLGKRNFFTKMVRIADLVHVPAVQDAVSDQYSEGCFATWDPTLDGLIATVTGSARPVDKGSITEDDLAVIVGVRPDGRGAQVRHVEGKYNDPPSSEAVEMMDMDSILSTITLEGDGESAMQAPVVRSKLHGHRGIAAYDPRHVEYVPMAPQYHYYPVSCATEAQARGIKDAFARSEALQDPDESRQVVFTVLPTHGIVIVEKWVNGKAPFQVMWEYMDAGYLQVESFIPQGLVEYLPGPDDRMVLQTAESAPTRLLRRG